MLQYCLRLRKMNDLCCIKIEVPQLKVGQYFLVMMANLVYTLKDGTSAVEMLPRDCLVGMSTDVFLTVDGHRRTWPMMGRTFLRRMGLGCIK